MALGVPARALPPSFRQPPRESCSETRCKKIVEESSEESRGFFRRVEDCLERRFAAFDEHVQARGHDFHARARLLRLRSRREEVSRFSGRHRSERARLFVSGPRENDTARSGPRRSRFQSLSQSVSRAARGKAREVVRHGPRLFLEQRLRSGGRRAETRAHRRQEKAGRREENAIPGARAFLSRTHVRRAFYYLPIKIQGAVRAVGTLSRFRQPE